MVRIKWRWSIQWMNLNPRDRMLVRNSEFCDAGCEDCVCSEQDHPEFLLQEEGQSGGTESLKTGSVSSRKTDRVHDLRLVSSHWCS